jgi:hypothetical protein
MSRMKRVCDLTLSDYPRENKEEEQTEPVPTSQEYFLALPDLKRRFPGKFRHAMESCVVTTQQMMLFIKNHELLKRLRNRNHDYLPMWRDYHGNLIPSRSDQPRRRRRNSPLPVHQVTASMQTIDESGNQSEMRVVNLPRIHSDSLTRLIQSLEEQIDQEHIEEEEQDAIVIQNQSNEEEEYLPPSEEEDEEEEEEDEDEVEENEEDNETGSVLSVTMDLIRTILNEGGNADQQQLQQQQEGRRASARIRERQQIQTPPSPRRRQVPYSLRPRNSNTGRMRRWTQNGDSVCHLVMTLPRSERERMPRFRVSWSRASALTFITNYITSIRYALVFIVRLSNEAITHIVDRAVPILQTTGLPPHLELVNIPDNSNVVEFLLNQFSSETSVRLAIHTMISEINDAYRMGEIGDIISREIPSTIVP